MKESKAKPENATDNKVKRTELALVFDTQVKNSSLIKVIEAIGIPLSVYEAKHVSLEDISQISLSRAVVFLESHENYTHLSVKYPATIKVIAVNGLSLFEQLSLVVKFYVTFYHQEIDLSEPTIEGESKKIYVWQNLALIDLKPTLYSFTYNRYGSVEGTDNLRRRFWKLFSSQLNITTSNFFFEKEEEGDTKVPSFDILGRNPVDTNYPFLTNYICEVTINGKSYSVVKFADVISPLEIIWKRYFVGTMKHNLKLVDQQMTKQKEIIYYDGKFPKDFVRFDWRNPLPDKDECIPDDFADFYIDVASAKQTAIVASSMLNDILSKGGYELVDICYFMNYEGKLIHSEITPDGMRIKKHTKSYDKDLWRQGKDRDTIIDTWENLYNDIEKSL